MKVKLRIVQGRPQGKSMVFPRGEYVFGRGEECHVRPNSDWVSRQHCLLVVTADGAVLRDLGSRNGTLINGTRLVDERSLDHGDQVQVGPLVFEVVIEEGVGEGSPAVAPSPARTPASADTASVPTMETAELPTAPPPPEEAPSAPELPAVLKG